MSAKARIRRDIESMSAYTPTTSLEVFAERLGRAPADLTKLDANENPIWALAARQRGAGEAPAQHATSIPIRNRAGCASLLSRLHQRAQLGRSSAAPGLTS